MDPNATLVEMRSLVGEILSGDRVNDESSEAVQLALHIAAMHEWLSKGGFLPDAWKR